jgi:predicted nucleic acid-binding protein
MLIVDTGFLVALYIHRDNLHSQALRFLKQNNQALITTAPVIVRSATEYVTPSQRLDFCRAI